jgi:ATP-binding protein involved in chromosome partitioning
MNKELILNALSNLTFKNGTKLSERISAIVIRNGNIGFSIETDENNIKEASSLREEANEILTGLTGQKVTIVLTSNNNIGESYVHDAVKTAKPASSNKVKVEGIKKVICISSGKGGVGKSTISALISQSLKEEGYKVGIIDADIYGPSLPKIFGVEDKKPDLHNGKFVPIEVKGIKVISVGLLVGEGSSLVWRGPMVTKAIYQLLKSTEWGALDYLIIDMPPGTGDIHLSLLEKFTIDGVVIVTTPQELAVDDAIRAINMYRKFNIPLLGVIENMSYILKEDGEKFFIFGQGGGERLARDYNMPLLAQLPVEPKLSSACDKGEWLAGKVDIREVVRNLILLKVPDSVF